MAVSCKTTIKKDVRKKHSRPSVVDDLKGTPTFDKEPFFIYIASGIFTFFVDTYPIRVYYVYIPVWGM